METKDKHSISNDYKKGFNAAWRLSEEMPQLFKNLQVPGVKKDEFSRGFDDGREQYIKDHQLKRNKDLSKGGRQLDYER